MWIKILQTEYPPLQPRTTQLAVLNFSQLAVFASVSEIYVPCDFTKVDLQSSQYFLFIDIKKVFFKYVL